MIFPFGKKKDDTPNAGQDKKNRSLDSLESELNVLGKLDMGKLGGGKETKKPLTDFSDLRDSPGGTIPL